MARITADGVIDRDELLELHLAVERVIPTTHRTPVVIYRKQKTYEAEVAILERYFEKNGEGYPDRTTGGVADVFKRLERARELLATQKAAASHSKRTCQ
jgi:transcription initiation factor IIE alpha subunit